MSPADQHGFFSPLAVAVVVVAAAVLLSFQLAGARVMNRGDLIGRRDIAGAGACALAVAPLGYACEEHEVTTEDGYILGLQRIPGGRGGHGAGVAGGWGGAGQPVLLQHGLLVVRMHGAK